MQNEKPTSEIPHNFPIIASKNYLHVFTCKLAIPKKTAKIMFSEPFTDWRKAKTNNFHKSSLLLWYGLWELFGVLVDAMIRLYMAGKLSFNSSSIRISQIGVQFVCQSVFAFPSVRSRHSSASAKVQNIYIYLEWLSRTLSVLHWITNHLYDGELLGMKVACSNHVTVKRGETKVLSPVKTSKCKNISATNSDHSS